MIFHENFLIIISAFQEKCPVSSCALSSLRSEAESADLVIFKDHFTMPTFRRPSHQKWMLYLLGVYSFPFNNCCIVYKFCWLDFTFEFQNVPSIHKCSNTLQFLIGLQPTEGTPLWWLRMSGGSITMKKSGKANKILFYWENSIFTISILLQCIKYRENKIAQFQNKVARKELRAE